ncbi:MAG: hypothetical protein M3Z17_02000 [Gemmatimonadota bacterium]|nr:hypothetical protein [Gemmatimonadota bacterium]
MIALRKVTRAPLTPPPPDLFSELRFIAALLAVSIVPVWFDRRLRRARPADDR